MSPGEGLFIDDLHAFGLIAAAGGVSAAARRFGLSKATLSRALTRLEDAAGGPLFDRAGKGLRLTPLGNLLRPSAEAAIAITREAGEVLRAAHGEPRGPLRLAATALTGQQLLAPVIAGFSRRYPSVCTTLCVTGGGPDPITGDFDLVFRIGPPEEPHLVARRVIAAPLRLYASRAGTRDVDLSDLRAVEALGRIVVDVPGVPRDWTLHDEGGRQVELTGPPMAVVGDPTIALGILRSGTGLAFLPALTSELRAGSGDLVRALPALEGPVLEVYASLPPRRARVPAVRAFLDMLVEHAGEVQASARR